MDTERRSARSFFGADRPAGESVAPSQGRQGLVAYIKANPGKTNFASGGNGSATHLTAEMFKSMAGLTSNMCRTWAIAGLGADIVGSSSAEFGDHLKSEIAKWSGVIKTSGATVD